MNDFGLLVGRYLSSLPSLSNQQLSELQLDASGRLIIAGRYLVDTASAASDPAILMLGQRRDADTTIATATGNYAPFQLDALGRLKVAADISVVNGAEKAEDAASADGDIGQYILAVRADSRPTNANTSTNGDYASFFVNNVGELWVKDADNLVKTTSIDATLTSLTKLEDTAAVDGSAGIQVFAQRHDADTSTVSTDGDLSLLHVNATGRLKVDATSSPNGSEQYSVTDALAAAGDGLITITAAATPWITVASLTVLTGTAYVYGWQWACDQNAQARLITDDGTDIIVYKNSLNSSSEPERSEHWCESGRIEIPGAALLEVKLQIKKRSATGGNANGSGSLHIRTV